MESFDIHIAATFTAEPVQECVDFLLGQVGLPGRVGFASYNQVFQELLSPQSTFASNQRGVNAVLLRLEDLVASEHKATDSFGDHVRKSLSELTTAILDAVSRFRVPLFVIICPPSAALLAQRHGSLVDSMEMEFLRTLASQPGLFAWRALGCPPCMPVETYDNPRGARLGGIPYTPHFYTALGRDLARKAHRCMTPPQKVIVLDCDQTLWKGVVGEEGVQGIGFDPGRIWLQSFMVQQAEAGMVLCICSKNNEPDVWEVFDSRTAEMPLRREHLVAWRINWQPKSENIQSLAKELQLGLDSFIFVDDDASVCAEVELNCPEVLTIRLPEDPANIPGFFESHWAFDHLATTAEDRKRGEMYRQNAERSRLLESASSLGDFLAGLDLRCEFAPCTEAATERVAQLTQRTNQFNASTLRRTDSELRAFLGESGNEGWTVTVSDRFGDYGLVGAVLLTRKDESLWVDSFLLSCRALGRGVEHRMLSSIGARARALGLASVGLPVYTTKKNKPAREFFEKVASAYRQPTDLGALYSLPADVAESISVSLTESPVAAASGADVLSQEAARGGSQSRKEWADALRRIAAEFHDTTRLREALERGAETGRSVQTPYETAASDAERQLIELWESVLKIRGIGATDDYFALGGDSVRAVRLFEQIEGRWGVELPLATLFTAPTVRQLAAVLARDTGVAEMRHSVPIQQGSSGSRLYCMHAAGGNVLFYRDLAQHLGPEPTVIGLQAREVPELGRFPDSVEEMSRRYLEEIEREDAEGPFRLCGSSFGGLLAYEMAQQLLQRGKRVEFVGLFDTYGPGYPKFIHTPGTLRGRAGSLVQRVNSLRSQFFALDRSDQAAFVRSRLSKLRVRMKRKWLWKKNEFQSKYQESVGGELPKDLQRNHKAIQRALASYRPKPIVVPITLFRARTQPAGIVPDPSLGWEPLCQGGLQIIESVGTHGAMTVDPYARELAAHLRRILNPRLFQVASSK